MFSVLVRCIVASCSFQTINTEELTSLVRKTRFHSRLEGPERGRRREVDVSPQRGNYLNAHGSWDPHISGSVSCCLFRAASYHV
ncbi:hypothetical protein BRADI_2g56706v3 [Brachypodium distachyon]|uniref:Uncharacterized protein n=1 Tax=Brachypodium distachyon TaxID=15368 RepID=A0A0Q3JEJ7_BRADI|nr:hypothetical protein BRADI_2g56706v3 [Brachypodium distachyon]